MIAVTKPQRLALAITTILAIIGGAYFLRGYFMLLVFAAIVAFMFNPVYKWMLKKGRKPKTAASWTLIISFLAIVIPLIIVVVLTIYQVASLASTISHVSTNVNLYDFLQRSVNSINNFLATLGISYKLTVSTVADALSAAVKSFGESLLNGLKSSVSGFIAFFTIVIIYIYVFISMLLNQDKLIKLFHQLNPLGKEISHLYASRTAAMTKAMVRGQFIIATTQGFTDALLLYLAGIHTGFFFFFLLLTALSIVPLGGGIIVIPIGIIMLLTGHVWQGLLVLGGHFLIVTNEDNVMRPHLVPKQARLDPALTLLSVFSGLRLFGFLGIIIGPVLMILIVTTIQVFLEVFKEIESVDRNSYSHRATKILHKLKFWDRQTPKTEG